MRRLLSLLFFLLPALFANVANAQIDKNYFYYMGRSFLLEEKYQEAIRVLNTLINADPEHYDAYYMRGIAKYNMEDLIGANSDFSKAIEKNPVFTMAYNNRAITRAQLGDYDDAIKDFGEVVALRPDLQGTYFNRGITYFQMRRYEEAVADFDEFIKRDDKISDAYLNRGSSYLFLKDTVRALEDYNKAIKTNLYAPQAYSRRGTLYLQQQDYTKALEDFDHALLLDSAYVNAWFNRAVVYASTQQPVEAISDFSKAIELEPRNALFYFNRAITRSQIGDYNKAVMDYDSVTHLAPNNVLAYYNRGSVNARIGDYARAAQDFTKCIELYPDFSNAYLNRSQVRAIMGDGEGARNDRTLAEEKISEYRSKLNDSTYSVYADTSRMFDQLLSFDTRMSSSSPENFMEEGGRTSRIALLPLFRFTYIYAANMSANLPRRRFFSQRMDDFSKEMENQYLGFVTRETDMAPDSVVLMDRQSEERFNRGEWKTIFERALTQGLVKQYANSISLYGEAIDRNPSNPFLYVNRSTMRSEMIDFVSSMEGSFQRMTLTDSADGLVNTSSRRTYNYDEAIADLNKAVKLYPEFPYIYYNRANLHAVSGRMAEACEDYSKAIELYPDFAEAYYNRGLILIYIKDTQKGCLDMSKAGELGIEQAYDVLRRYANIED